MYATRLHVLPFADTLGEAFGDIFGQYVMPYYQEAYRPATKGNTFTIRGVEFKIVDIEPSDFAVIAPSTVIFMEGEPV